MATRDDRSTQPLQPELWSSQDSPTERFGDETAAHSEPADAALPDPPRNDRPKPPASAPLDGKTLPPAVPILLAALVLAVLILSARLLLVRTGPAPPNDAVSPLASAGPRSASATATDQDLLAFVESWRIAWEERQFDHYQAHYSATFGAQGTDYAGWMAAKERSFEATPTVTIETLDPHVERFDHIAVVSFVQSYRAGEYEDRGRKRLYLAPSSAGWRIFNEEWSPIDSPP